MQHAGVGRYLRFFPLLAGFLVFAVILAVWYTGSGVADSGNKTNPDAKKPVKLVYVDWASEKASAHVVKAVIESRFDRECQVLSVSLIAMWESLAAGDQDASVAAWLPSLQKRYLEKHKADVKNLGPNLEGTKIGLAVPEYVPINSIAELNGHAPKFDNKIIGIDPYAGIMGKTAAAMDAYGLSAFDLVSGSGPTMTTALEKAIAQQRWIVVTGWTPHWKFAEWDLKYLEDPKNVYGRKEHIATIVRKGLKQDMPEIHAFFENFYWHPRNLEAVMKTARHENTSYPEAARKWVASHPELADQWVK